MAHGADKGFDGQQNLQDIAGFRQAFPASTEAAKHATRPRRSARLLFRIAICVPALFSRLLGLAPGSSS
jgi:hypothetical protein